MKLLKELIEEVDYITEVSEDSGVKKHYITGIFLQSDLKNKNGRIYPEEVMDKEASRYVNESVNRNTAWGELNHPSNGFGINLDKVCHRIVELTKDGKNWIGKALITDTPNGNIVKGLLNSGGRIGTSSRALGSLKMNNEGTNIVQGDFRISTAGDVVGDPSAPDAWLTGIMENVEYFYDEKTGLYKQSEIAKEEIRTLSIKQINENKLKLFQKFLNSIK